MKRQNENENSTNKEKKTRYRCEKCGTEFYITVKPSFCAVCGSDQIYKGSKKAFETAKRYLDECNSLIPQIEETHAKLTELYIRYMTVHETLKTYASRGIISKDKVPVFKFPSMTEAFYAQRKKKSEE